MVDSWDIDLKTFGMGIALHRGLASTPFMKFQFVETEGVYSSEQEPGFQEFLRNAAMSGGASREEIDFLQSLRFRYDKSAGDKIRIISGKTTLLPDDFFGFIVQKGQIDKKSNAVLFGDFAVTRNGP